MAWRSAVSRSRRAATCCCSSWLNSSMRARPRSLARYMAASASRSSCSADEPCAADGDADAGGRVQLAPRQRDRLVQRRDDALGELDRLADVGDVFAHDHELVAAEAGDGVGRADRAWRAGCATSTSSWSPTTWPRPSFTSLKRSRSRKSTATLVVGALGACQRVREAVDEQQAVREAREVVVQRLVRERLLGALAVGDVAHLHEVVARARRRRRARAVMSISTDDDAAVGAHHAVLALVERRVAAQEPLDPAARALALGRVEELERAAAEQPFDGVRRAARRARGSPT